MSERTAVLHPVAWWLWALGLAVAASATTNPLLLLLICAVAAVVVAARRGPAPWAVGFRWYLAAAALVVVVRVVFRMLTSGAGPTVLFALPVWRLPGGVHLLGPVSAEAVVAGLYDGLRLGTLLICVGAANTLANPKRLLAAAPAALYELGTVLVVSVTVFPQLVESVARVRRASALRAGTRSRRRRMRAVLLPVLTDALDRSLELAASMDSRGYGRRPERSRRSTTTLLLGAVLGLAVGVYAVLDPGAPVYLGVPVLGLAVISAVLGLRLAGARVERTRYRPDLWTPAAWAVAVSGAAAAVFTVSGSVSTLYPSVSPLAWPVLPVLPALGVLIAALPARVAPAPRAVLA